MKWKHKRVHKVNGLNYIPPLFPFHYAINQGSDTVTVINVICYTYAYQVLIKYDIVC